MTAPNTTTASEPVFQAFSWHTDDEKEPANRAVHRDVRRLEVVEDILRGNALLVGLLEHDESFTPDGGEVFGPLHRGQLYRFLISTNAVMAELLAEDRDGLADAISARAEAARRDAELRDFEARR